MEHALQAWSAQGDGPTAFASRALAEERANDVLLLLVELRTFLRTDFGSLVQPAAGTTESDADEIIRNDGSEC